MIVILTTVQTVFIHSVEACALLVWPMLCICVSCLFTHLCRQTNLENKPRIKNHEDIQAQTPKRALRKGEGQSGTIHFHNKQPVKVVAVFLPPHPPLHLPLTIS